MFGFTAKTQFDAKHVKTKSDKGTFNSLRHAGFSLAKRVKASIKKSPTPSAPGAVPTTRGKGGKNLRGAIYTAAEPGSVLVGPRESFVGLAGYEHEFGKPRPGGNVDPEERPFMLPELMASLDRFPNEFRGSIGE